MENEEKKMESLQNKSHEALLKILNNIGIIGAILAGIADIVFVIIFTIGLEIDISATSNILFACINALIGVLINVLLRFQGQKYAEIENQELCNKYYDKIIKEKKYISMKTWQIIGIIKDILIKGGSAAFSIFGLVYISIDGSGNPIQILITIASLVLFGCFGLMNMHGAYQRFYNYQIPFMKKEIQEKENK